MRVALALRLMCIQILRSKMGSIHGPTPRETRKKIAAAARARNVELFRAQGWWTCESHVGPWEYEEWGDRRHGCLEPDDSIHRRRRGHGQIALHLRVVLGMKLK